LIGNRAGPSLEIPAQAAEVVVVLVLFAEGCEHLGNVHIEVPSRGQALGDPLELGFDELGLGSGYDVRDYDLGSGWLLGCRWPGNHGLPVMVVHCGRAGKSETFGVP
jgi:hypothetical protein